MGVFKPFLIPAKPDNQVLLFQHSKVNSSPRGKITFLSVNFFFNQAFDTWCVPLGSIADANNVPIHSTQVKTTFIKTLQ
jgi:hypothetical protein